MTSTDEMGRYFNYIGKPPAFFTDLAQISRKSSMTTKQRMLMIPVPPEASSRSLYEGEGHRRRTSKSFASAAG
ncbi:hypothetical protein FOZ62_014789 [Perkinsus olseni]|uniref:Uncharacterized protein n=1 Tax=Perkinsus olseni TaxID=32597 RepID=A0A7J6QBH5_PEROL|nr:hypothetical protein FOZ62_014789 [Perkinsus olseni]